MAFQIVTVQYEVRWVATYGISGNELPPARWETLGEFETEGDAARAMAENGFTLKDGGWSKPYTYGYIERKLREIK